MTQQNPAPTTRSLGTTMTVAAWLLVLGVLTVYFSGFLDAQDNPNQLVSGAVAPHGVREIKLKQNRQGHYVATGEINGKSVRFLLDTGATEVSVPQDLAEYLGLRRGRPQTVWTANGSIVTYDSRLDEVRLGPIALRGVGAHINPHMDGEEVLLGMSFLKDLELVQRESELTIRQRPSLN
tara:strand:- start:44 stop:583 length:540 start_codon:yes stop_codon:yes gene_type:complete